MSRIIARRVLEELVAQGVRQFCVCAGARNIELIAPLLADGVPVRVWHFFEERSAAFFAVGRMMVEEEPVAVVTTSGTAAAELLPAMIEAHYQGLPLVAVTADRPPGYRGSGAPQAIEQVGIFSAYSQRSVDVVSEVVAQNCLEGWDGHGPWHLNVCQGEPEAGDDGPMAWSPRSWETRRDAVEWDAGFVRDRGGLVVLLGDLTASERVGLADFLRRLGAPVAAEAGSGLRENPEIAELVLRGGDHSLRRLDVRKVLRIGGVPSWRFWRDLESRPEIAVFSLCRTGYPGLARFSHWAPLPDFSAVVISKGTPIQPAAIVFPGAFPRSECGFVRALSESIPKGSRVFLGNSLSIREWNIAATFADRGLRCCAARGANGIDGQVATFFGAGADDSESWLVCGDLTALYDLSAPWIVDQLPPARRRIVVINNGGGKIFARLPALRAFPESTRRAVENAHGRSFEAWAAMWGMDYLRVTDPGQLGLPPIGTTAVIEIVPDPGESEAFWEAWERT